MQWRNAVRIVNEDPVIVILTVVGKGLVLLLKMRFPKTKFSDDALREKSISFLIVLINRKYIAVIVK